MEPKKTPLYDIHVRLGARMVDFAGWLMPVQYESVIAEHEAVRTAAGLFDTCHMGEIEIAGKGALDAVQRLATNDASKLTPGKAQYSLVCNDEGGVVDDVIVYRHAEDRFVFCVNASNAQKVMEWFKARAGGMAEIKDLSGSTAMVAIQGPAAQSILSAATDFDLDAVKNFRFANGRVLGLDATVARTGYTGEDGFEIFTAAKSSPTLWEGLMRAGEGAGLRPAGLGARDTLRVEMGYPLYGAELDMETTPLEAGLSRFVNLDGGSFIGRQALLEQRAGGLKRKLVGFLMNGPGIARSGYPILKDGKVVGKVTSGTHSPSLKRAVGMGYVDSLLSAPDTRVQVEIRGRAVAAVIATLPFYRRQRDERARRPS